MEFYFYTNEKTHVCEQERIIQRLITTCPDAAGQELSRVLQEFHRDFEQSLEYYFVTLYKGTE